MEPSADTIPSTLSTEAPLQIPVVSQPSHAPFFKIIFILVAISLASGGAFAMFVYRDTIKSILGGSTPQVEDKLISSSEKDAMTEESKLLQSEKLTKYNNDYKRSLAVANILATIRLGRSTLPNGELSSYPKDIVEIKKIFADRSSKISSSTETIFDDPSISQSISYNTTNKGDNFELKVTFETEEAVSAIKDFFARIPYGTSSVISTATSTRFDGRSVVLSKDSPSSLYLPSIMKITEPLEPVSSSTIATTTDNNSVTLATSSQKNMGTDSLVATGFVWESKPNRPKFASVMLPIWGFDRDSNWNKKEYKIEIWDGGKYVFYKTTIPAHAITFPNGGVSKFRITGIDTKLKICPMEKDIYTWMLTFTKSGQFEGVRTPITEDLSPQGEKCQSVR